MDGNNSLKLVDSTYRAGTVRTDTRTTTSPRWIHPEAVDVFKDEVSKVKFYHCFNEYADPLFRATDRGKGKDRVQEMQKS
jgi:hypothetical protein